MHFTMTQIVVHSSSHAYLAATSFDYGDHNTLGRLNAAAIVQGEEHKGAVFRGEVTRRVATAYNNVRFVSLVRASTCYDNAEMI
jgi:hypothetical protein